METAMSLLVEAQGLALPGRLEETSLTLEAGALICLVGPNGSGKTSLLHALAGIGRPAGQVRIDGADPASASPTQRQRLLSYLPAAREVAWPLDARSLIRLGSPEPEHLPRVLEALDLAAFEDRRMDRISTGERSRVLIARALASRPRLLLLDEPAANLDPLWQLRLMDFLRIEARANAQAALVAVHDLDLAGAYADRLLIMAGGRIVADGDPEELLAGDVVPRVFGIERVEGRWRPVA
jgi:iron complex transport system ATP-binding protein